MISYSYSKNRHYTLGLKILLSIWICFSIIASAAISIPTSDVNKSIYKSENPENCGLRGCSVDIYKPVPDTAYFFDNFEVTLAGIHLPVIFGGITCNAEVNVSDGVVPAFIQWRFANWLGDTWWSKEYTYVPGKTKYDHYIGNINFGQFKIWIKCFDIDNEVICEDTVSCLKIF